MRGCRLWCRVHGDLSGICLLVGQKVLQYGEIGNSLLLGIACLIGYKRSSLVVKSGQKIRGLFGSMTLVEINDGNLLGTTRTS